MKTVLRLQTLTPTLRGGELDIILMSTYSGVCPTTLAGDATAHFQME